MFRKSGGISLAVYMHGITKEIWRLARASRAYHAGQTPHVRSTEHIYCGLLREIEDEADIRLRVLPDIIAGASAGAEPVVDLGPAGELEIGGHDGSVVGEQRRDAVARPHVGMPAEFVQQIGGDSPLLQIHSTSFRIDDDILYDCRPYCNIRFGQNGHGGRIVRISDRCGWRSHSR